MHLFMTNNNKSISFFIFLFSSSLFQPLFADVDSRITPPPDSSTQMNISSSSSSSSISNSNSSSPRTPPPNYANPATPFKPSIAVIIGVLTTMFSLTLLILLYAKHCKQTHIHNSFNGGGTGTGPTTDTRKNSGIDRTVIESLPIFRFCSLRGQKDGLECSVCLTKFEPTEVLRLLPKCKHAFHVECVDTWLDAHSTCPLCRYRVDPEDILLIDHENTNSILPVPPVQPQSQSQSQSQTKPAGRRIAGRHSSAGEKASGFVLSQIVVQRPNGVLSERISQTTSFARRSLDSFSFKKNVNNGTGSSNRSDIPTSGTKTGSNSHESVAVGCFNRYQSNQRKDGLLLLNNGNGDGDGEGTSEGAGVDKTRFEHRIIVSGYNDQRWSDVHPSDLLYLRSEMIISEGRGGLSRPRRLKEVGEGGGGERSGRNVINLRSVSEITGLNRYSSHSEIIERSNNSRHHRERQAGVVSRWLAWISSQSHPAVRSFRTTIPSSQYAAV